MKYGNIYSSICTGSRRCHEKQAKFLWIKCKPIVAYNAYSDWSRQCQTDVNVKNHNAARSVWIMAVGTGGGGGRGGNCPPPIFSQPKKFKSLK